MTKQNFISMSLESGLKGIDGNGDIATLIALDTRGSFSTDLDLESNEGEMHVLDGNFKPILHPLSDLTKEIEHGGEKFVPIKNFHCGLQYVTLKNEMLSIWDGDMWTDKIDAIPLGYIQKLIEWHFDIADLISKNEAIDVNTLETNPYK